jgi:hypothetical protein
LLASISTVDLAYHVRAGAVILDGRALPSPDTFTFTAAGQPWVDQQWAAQTVFAAVFRVGGWGLLTVLRAAAVGTISWLVFRAARSSGVGTRAAAWLTLAGFGVGLVALGLRPQLLGMVLFAATVAILAGRDRYPRLVGTIPLIALAWANVHGSFFLAPAAVGVAWLEDTRSARPGARRLLAVLVASGLATLLNPYGPSVWNYAVGLAANPTIRRLITEWQPTSPLSFAGLMFYGSIVALLIGMAIWLRAVGPRDRRALLDRAWPTLAWLGGLIAIGAFAERGVAWWSIAAPVAVARLIAIQRSIVQAAGADAPPGSATPPTGEPRRSLVPSLMVAVLCLAVVGLLPVWRAGDVRYGPPGLLTDAPRGLTEALAAEVQPGIRIWNAQRWGSWLEFAMPDAKVAVDSRIEFFPAYVWDDHLAVSAGAPGWEAILDRWQVTVVVASATEQRSLIPLLRASPVWTAVYDGPDGAVFVRRPH